MENEFDKFLENLKNRLDNNPDIKEKIQDHIDALEELFEADVDVNIVYNSNVNEYREIYDAYKGKIVEPDDESIMILEDFLGMLNNEEKHLKLSFDPLYLKEGINNVNNMLITTYDDNIIIVPTIKKEEE